MSAPLDVLAVLDREIEQRGDEPYAQDMREARAAVAELVEADRAFDAANLALVTTDPQSEDADTMSAMRAHRDHCRARRRAALAKFGGAV